MHRNEIKWIVGWRFYLEKKKQLFANLNHFVNNYDGSAQVNDILNDLNGSWTARLLFEWKVCRQKWKRSGFYDQESLLVTDDKLIVFKTYMH